jgi:GntR family transcriptional repressor for pyruvate dehydrogenase complex
MLDQALIFGKQLSSHEGTDRLAFFPAQKGAFQHPSPFLLMASPLHGPIARLILSSVCVKRLACRQFFHHGGQGWVTVSLEADLEFHGIIASACSNSMLRSLYQTFREQLTETQRQPIPITEPSRMKASVAEHRAIIEALRSNDVDRARLAMEAHVRNTARCAGLYP